jgi:hypothetical protein
MKEEKSLNRSKQKEKEKKEERYLKKERRSFKQGPKEMHHPLFEL